ncbi:uncharacterized protein LOC132551284 [Ylistrum balloti]|uniref:uncharacterized protein LOC132551284 n=1 Tax=Ylistrum balloti TaxID=509963 RepID=UPI002905F3AC|nr:uncharacterized protein LOC132551284 [Ylistrum balloti]
MALTSHHVTCTAKSSISSRLIVSVVYVISVVTELSSAVRVPRRTGDQPTVGNCLSFNFGGVSRLHWYSCCNNCIGDKNSTCPSTYQSASNNKYCDSCGRDTKGGNGDARNRGKQFSCGGCQGQGIVDKKCREWWKEIPGFCWAYTLCFVKQCEGKYKNCGNRKCDKGETKENCPIDCFDKPCCGEATCCFNNTSSGQTLFLPDLKLFTTVVVLAFIYNEHFM